MRGRNFCISFACSFLRWFCTKTSLCCTSSQRTLHELAVHVAPLRIQRYSQLTCLSHPFQTHSLVQFSCLFLSFLSRLFLPDFIILHIEQKPLFHHGKENKKGRYYWKVWYSLRRHPSQTHAQD
jgi:hypothetical protein